MVAQTKMKVERTMEMGGRNYIMLREVQPDLTGIQDGDTQDSVQAILDNRVQLPELVLNAVFDVKLKLGVFRGKRRRKDNGTFEVRNETVYEVLEMRRVEDNGKSGKAA